MKKNAILMVVVVCFSLLICSCGKQGNLIETDLIPVQIGDKYGFVNHKGKTVIQPQFDLASFFSEGLALVRIGDKFGYINKKGKFEIDPVYKNATLFNEGIAWTVKETGAPVAINKNGKILFELKDAEVVTCFSEGVAKFGIIDPESEYSSDCLYGFVNKKGEIIIQPIYKTAESFYKGLALVRKDYTEKYGFIDKEGKFVINPQFDKAKSFNDMGQAIVMTKNSGTGVIDKEGKFVINPQFDAMITDKGCYVIATDNLSKFGWCDDKGKIIINPQFEFALQFNGNDLAPVKMGDKYGYVDKSGKIVINPQYDYALPFAGDIAIIEMSEKAGLINKKGEYMANPQFASLGLGFNFMSDFNIDAGYITQVKSDYFNMTTITDRLKKFISGNTVDSIGFNTPVSDIMTKYRLSKSAFDYYYSYCRAKNLNISPDAKLDLTIYGDFANIVSDGWWGFHRVLNPSSKPTDFYISISLENKGAGRVDTLYSEILKTFNIKNNGKDLQIGKIGNLYASFAKNSDSDIITITISSKQKSLPSSDEEYTDNDSDITSYKGKINNKYDIVMDLGFEAGVVYGSYYYTSNSNKTPIEINGTYGMGDEITMIESSNGKNTGTFTGKMVGNEISGTWINADGTKTMPFAVYTQQ